MERVIYKATCLLNDKIYIGQTKNLEHRIKEHIRSANKKNSSLIFHKAIRKYGEINFKWEKIYSGSDLIDEIEEYFIKYYCSFYKNGKGYNMSFGPANKGFSHSDKFKKEMSNRMKGNKYAAGRVLSDEDKERLRLSRLANPLSKEVRMTMNDDKLNTDVFIFTNGKDNFKGIMRDFSRKYNIDRSAVTKLVNGKLKTTSGWYLDNVQNNW